MNKIAELKGTYATLVELESELETIRSGGSIISHEKESLNPQGKAKEKWQ